MLLLALVTCGALAQKKAQDSLHAALNKELSKGQFVGFSVAIVTEKGIAYEKGFGQADAAQNKPYTAQTLQNIGSISKTLVGIALLKAQELGHLKLEDSVNKYLPFAVRNPYFPKDAITLRQLATHTSTITDNAYYLTQNYILKPNQNLEGLPLELEDEQKFNPAANAVSLEDYLKNTLTTQGKWHKAEDFLNKKPGAVHAYSNVGTALAAFVIERATGMRFDLFTKKYILDPLKMKASGWKFPDVDFSKHARLYLAPGKPLPYYALVTYPDGNFITSAHDLGLFLQELIRGYNGKGKLLSRESYKTYFTPALTAAHYDKRNEKNPYSDEFNVGVFMSFSVTGNIGHTGGDPGVTTMMFIDPKTSIGKLLIVNTNIIDKAGNDEFYGIWKALEKQQSAFKK